MNTVTFTLPMMFGDHHVVAVHELLQPLPGIDHVYASSAFHIVEVTYDETETTDQEIHAVLVQSGYLDEIDVPTELAERSDDKKNGLFFRHTKTFPQTQNIISFAQDTPSPKRPLWPCPGLDK